MPCGPLLSPLLYTGQSITAYTILKSNTMLPPPELCTIPSNSCLASPSSSYCHTPLPILHPMTFHVFCLEYETPRGYIVRAKSHGALPSCRLQISRENPHENGFYRTWISRGKGRRVTKEQRVVSKIWETCPTFWAAEEGWKALGRKRRQESAV